jgi:hypothetical protein
MNPEERIPKNDHHKDEVELARAKSLRTSRDAKLDQISEPLSNPEYIRAWEEISPGASSRALEIVSAERAFQRKARRWAAVLEIIKGIIQVLSVALACAVVVYAIQLRGSSSINIWLALVGLIGGVVAGQFGSMAVRWRRHRISDRQAARTPGHE